LIIVILSGAEPFNNKMIGSVNADHVEPFITGGGKAVRRCRCDYDNVASTRNYLLSINDHYCLTGKHQTSLGIGMFMQSWTFPWCEVAQKEGDAGTVWLTFEFDRGDCAFPLVATTYDMEHSSSPILALRSRVPQRYA
jgi:hypothetical protein